MAVKLNNRAYEHAKALINEGKFVVDERDAWNRPRSRRMNLSSGTASPNTENGI
jgi:hypothetical protein